MMYSLKLIPQDTLFFRDGKPFGSEDSTFADTIFPPFPSTFMGALRAAVISASGHSYERFASGKNRELTEWLGSFTGNAFTPSKALKILGIFLQKGNDKYYVAPTDLGVIKIENKNNKCVCEMDGDEPHEKKPSFSKFYWAPSSALPFVSLRQSLDYHLLNAGEYDLEPARNIFLDSGSVRDYLLGCAPGNGGCLPPTAFYRDEEQIKNSLDRKTRTTREDGGLFMYKVKRVCEGVSFLIVFESPDNAETLIGKSGFIALGGESRLAHFQFEGNNFRASLPVNYPDLQKAYNPETDLLKLILQTPAFANQGVPEAITDRFHIKGIAVNGLSAIGGWDMGMKFPKDMLRAYQPGTVFLVEPKSGLDEAVFDSIVLNPVFSDRKNEEGYGSALVGIEKNCKGGK